MQHFRHARSKAEHHYKLLQDLDWEDVESEKHPLGRYARHLQFLKPWLPYLRRSMRFFAGAILAVIIMLSASFPSGHSASPRAIVTAGWQKTTAVANGHHADGFRDFIKDDQCKFASTDIHKPFTPLCKDRESLLAAMSGGGRIGWDEPYQPRGCDMQWFTRDEICKILSRFDHIYFLGDSLMRHTVMAMMVLIRGDLVNGARATWRHDDPSLEDCKCHRLFHDKECVWMSAIGSPAVLAGDPDSIKCPKDKPPAIITWNPTLAFPLKEDAFDYMPELANRTVPDGRIAFVLSHGLWNDLDLPMSMAWFEQIQDRIARHMPAYASTKLSQRLFPRLFVAPTAQGELKPSMVVPTQNNLRLVKTSTEMRSYVRARGYDHLGLYNLTVQATSPDGTHATMENNLAKAMMVLNWLNMIDPPAASEWEAEAQRAKQREMLLASPPPAVGAVGVADSGSGAFMGAAAGFAAPGASELVPPAAATPLAADVAAGTPADKDAPAAAATSLVDNSSSAAAPSAPEEPVLAAAAPPAASELPSSAATTTLPAETTSAAASTTTAAELPAEKTTSSLPSSSSSSSSKSSSSNTNSKSDAGAGDESPPDNLVPVAVRPAAPPPPDSPLGRLYAEMKEKQEFMHEMGLSSSQASGPSDEEERQPDSVVAVAAAVAASRKAEGSVAPTPPPGSSSGANDDDEPEDGSAKTATATTTTTAVASTTTTRAASASDKKKASQTKTAQ